MARNYYQNIASWVLYYLDLYYPRRDLLFKNQRHYLNFQLFWSQHHYSILLFLILFWINIHWLARCTQDSYDLAAKYNWSCQYTNMSYNKDGFSHLIIQLFISSKLSYTLKNNPSWPFLWGITCSLTFLHPCNCKCPFLQGYTNFASVYLEWSSFWTC